MQQHIRGPRRTGHPVAWAGARMALVRRFGNRPGMHRRGTKRRWRRRAGSRFLPGRNVQDFQRWREIQRLHWFMYCINSY
ncbi:hypothetical protein Aave_3703 [Paracidovorax citrulli AAC00-1]|uniref:Uncharacterized protein n=1 Tax=Paracidovorax citrulli (strain AAC00-1) TaxID=397945 RepID=A1TTG3_PARC0|nr:hypothetical protein Aave_3703 [Paracidovorax citrulli AAC00-1]